MVIPDIFSALYPGGKVIDDWMGIDNWFPDWVNKTSWLLWVPEIDSVNCSVWSWETASSKSSSLWSTEVDMSFLCEDLLV